MKYDVVALGELLIDFAPVSRSETGYPVLAAQPGGAPGNFLAALNKFGLRTAMIGKVGDDMFGRLLLGTLEAAGIDTSGVLADPSVFTTMAFVSLDESGNRDFSFARKPGADTCLRPEDVNETLLRNTKVFHFGTLSVTHEGVREATHQAVAMAKEAGALISFDPNYRPPLWDTEAHAREAMAWGLSQCDILKIADNELLFLTGESDFEKGASILLDRFPNIRLLNITAGPDGSHCFFGGRHVFVPGFKVRTIETTGAGDTFCACVLHDVLQNGLENRTDDSLAAMLRFANAAAAIVTTRKGALRSMPSKQDIQTLFS